MDISSSDIFWGILKGILGLVVLVVSHELGHFLFAKKAGVLVEEFGVGFPPKILARKIGETLYSLNLIPLGGFVKLHGEIDQPAGGDGVREPARAFVNASKKARLAISLAGVLGNFLFAIFCFGIVYSFLGIPKETKDVRVLEVSAGSPAQTAGILTDDILKEVDGKAVRTTTEFRNFVSEKKGQEIEVNIKRRVGDKFEEKTLTLIPRESPPEGEGPLGVVVTTTEIYYPPIYLRPFYGAYYGIINTFETTKGIILGLGSVAQGVSQGKAPEGVAGPVGIFAVIIYVAKLGTLPFINLLGAISTNLAVVNLIPFPPLDGSRVLFIGFESAFGRRVLPKIENAIHTIGFVALIALTIYISTREVGSIISGGLPAFLDSIIR